MYNNNIYIYISNQNHVGILGYWPSIHTCIYIYIHIIYNHPNIQNRYACYIKQDIQGQWYSRVNLGSFGPDHRRRLLPWSWGRGQWISPGIFPLSCWLIVVATQDPGKNWSFFANYWVLPWVFTCHFCCVLNLSIGSSYLPSRTIDVFPGSVVSWPWVVDSIWGSWLGSAIHWPTVSWLRVP